MVASALSSHPRLHPRYLTRMQTLLENTSLVPLHVLPFRPAEYPPWLLPHPSICTSILPCAKQSTSPLILYSTFLDHLETHSSAVHVYTDGSKTSTGTGFAVLFPDRSYEYNLPQIAGILTAELYALLRAVEHISSRPSSSFVIFSDSLSALTILQSCLVSHPLVLKILEWLFRLSVKKKSVQFCWVPSHVGIPGNERVDALARSATVSRTASTYPLPASDYFTAFSDLIYHRWQLSWSTIRTNKLSSVKPMVTPWSDPYHRRRRWETALARLRIGHTRLTHGHLMSKDPPPKCPHCESRLTVVHILLSCPRYTTLRTNTFPFLTQLGHPPTIKDILSESDHFSISRLMHFLTSIGNLSDI